MTDIIDKSRVYDPKGVLTTYEYNDDCVDWPFIENPSIPAMHIQGWDSANPSVIVLVCKVCGTDKLQVGRSTYYTAVKCPECEYEICVHEG